MKKFLIIFLLAGLMSACSQEEINPIETGTEQSRVSEDGDCAGPECAGGERESPGNERSKERGITIK